MTKIINITKENNNTKRTIPCLIITTTKGYCYNPDTSTNNDSD